MNITRANANEIFDRLEKNNQALVLFGLSSKDYESASKNEADVRNYIILNNNVLKQYRDYYEGDDGIPN